MTEAHPPQPPATPTEPGCGQIVRRGFLSRVSIALSSIIGGLISLPAVGFVLAPFLKKVPRHWRDVGKVDDFEQGKTVKVQFEELSPLPWAGVTARTAAWLRRESATEFIAFSINCRHLGCPVRWLPDAELFMCPCHGGVYYQDGTVAAGPPPEPLMRFPVRISDGQVQIQTSPIPLPGDELESNEPKRG